MKIQVLLHTLDNKEWWFDIGISYQKAIYNRKKYLITIGIVFFSVYVRW